MVKDLLRKVLGRSRVNFEELYTIICDIESVINSRPLTYVAEGELLKPLTPLDFLINAKFGCEVGDLNLVDENILKETSKHIHELREQLKNRFTKEYLGLLVHRGKNPKRCNEKLEIGEIVLVEEDKLKRIIWRPLGRI